MTEAPKPKTTRTEAPDDVAAATIVKRPAGRGEREPAAPRAAWALLLVTALSLLLVHATRLLLQTIPTAWLHDPDVGLGARTLRLLLPLLPFVAPALPLSAWLGRTGALVATAVAAAAGAVALGLSGGVAALVAAGVVAAGASAFLGAAIGVVNRRAVAAGVGGGFILEHVARLARFAPAGRPASLALLLPVVAVVLVALVLWHRARPTEPGPTFERRAGGLRLRGGLAFGALLFLEFQFLTPSDTALVAPVTLALLVAAGLAGWCLVAWGTEVRRHRSFTATLSVTALAGALVVGWSAPPAPLLWLAGHFAAVVLLDRALAPGGGRRSGLNLVLAFALLLGLWAADALRRTFVFVPHGLPVWVLLAGVVVIAGLYLKPRPSAAAAALPIEVAAGAAIVVEASVIAALLWHAG